MTMATCSFRQPYYSGNTRVFTLEVTEYSQSIANNTSTVKWKLILSEGGGYCIDTYAKVVVNGSEQYNKTVSYSSYVFPGYDGSVEGYIYNIPHNSDGTKSISFSVEGYSYQRSVNSASGSLTLTRIPRNSSITDSSTTSNRYYFNTNVPFTITPAVSGIKHTVYYTVGGTTYTILNNSTSTSFNYKFPESLVSNFPNSVNADIAYYCRNEYGLVTGPVYARLKVPEAYKPRILGVTISENTMMPQNINGNNTWPFVQNKSNIKVYIDYTTSGGSPINSVYSKVNGTAKTVREYYIDTTNPISNGVVSNVQVTDKRGRVSDAVSNQSYSIVGYNNPSILESSLSRCTSTGLIDDSEGQYIKFVFKAEISPVQNLNKKFYRLKYRISGSTGAYTVINLSNTYYALEENRILTDSNGNPILFPINNSYEFVFEVEDSFRTTSYTKPIRTGFDIMNINPNGNAIAFGKMSESETPLMEVGMPAKFYDNIEVEGSIVLDSMTVSKNNFIDMIYPVGSVYLSMNNTNPGTLFGRGTWVRLTGGYLYATGSNAGGGTGGSSTTSSAGGGNTGSTTLTAAQSGLPSHNHLITSKTTSYASGSQTNWRCLSWTGTNADWTQEVWSDTQGGWNASQGHTHSLSRHTHTIDPVYIGVVMWKRTA